MVAVVKPKFKYDDALDAFGVHGMGGIVGSILTGVLLRGISAAKAVWKERFTATGISCGCR